MSYRAVDVAADYTPDRPFRGLILDAAADVEVVGTDGHSCVVPMTAGMNDTGGIGIKAAGTDATVIVAVF